jgi:hypothetical protein
MAFSELERYRFEKPIKAFVEARRPPPHSRQEIDIGYRFNNQSIELFEARPAFDRRDEVIEHPIAKATYVKSTNTWKIYWMRADLKWHRYEPQPTASKVEEFIAEVNRDPYGCFFG